MIKYNRFHQNVLRHCMNKASGADFMYLLNILCKLAQSITTKNVSSISDGFLLIFYLVYRPNCLKRQANFLNLSLSLSDMIYV